MFEYLPWSKNEQAICLNAYQLNIFTILDIELGGKCGYNCLYCDSPDRNKKSEISIEGIERLMVQGKFRWVYICGLGEPTENGENYRHLIAILKLCERYDLRCNIYSNLSNLTDELKEYIRKDILYVLFKFDTQNAENVRKLYGTSKPQEQLNAVNEIKELVHFENGATNVAASIVPTQFNRDEIPSLISSCINAHIFPLIGELESSGRGADNYNNLYLTDADLAKIKTEIEKLWEADYSIPMCPAVISGIHIDNTNHITVDKVSGLSCHWFWLTEPKTEIITVLDANCDVSELSKQIIQYRKSKADWINTFLNSKSSIGGAFGGCGGDVNALFRTYLSVSGYYRKKLTMDEVFNLVNSAYNHIANDYAAAYSENDDEDFHFFDYFVSQMRGKQVLDMGCGVGANTSLLHDSGIKVIGVDASSEMLRNAKEMYPHLKFEEQNILHTSYADHSFDGIVLSYVIEHFNEEGLQLLHKEINRLLKDAGLLFITSHEGNGEALLADPLDESISIYYNFLTCENIDSLFSDYDRVLLFKRASYGPEEFLNDKIFVTYQKHHEINALEQNNKN